MLLIIGRTIKESFINFWRNGWLSIASVSVLTLSLYVVGALMVILFVSSNVLQKVESRINVSVYFKPNTTEERIMIAKADLEKYNEVASVEYVSKEQALADFKKIMPMNRSSFNPWMRLVAIRFWPH